MSATQAQIDNAIAVNFSHRLNPTIQPEKIISLYESLSPTLKRAAAIADLLEVAAEVDYGSALDSDSVHSAAQTIRMELSDARAMLDAFFNQQATKPQADILPES